MHNQRTGAVDDGRHGQTEGHAELGTGGTPAPTLGRHGSSSVCCDWCTPREGIDLSRIHTGVVTTGRAPREDDERRSCPVWSEEPSSLAARHPTLSPPHPSRHCGRPQPDSGSTGACRRNPCRTGPLMWLGWGSMRRTRSRCQEDEGAARLAQCKQAIGLRQPLTRAGGLLGYSFFVGFLLCRATTHHADSQRRDVNGPVPQSPAPFSLLLIQALVK